MDSNAELIKYKSKPIPLWAYEEYGKILFSLEEFTLPELIYYPETDVTYCYLKATHLKFKSWEINLKKELIWIDLGDSETRLNAYPTTFTRFKAVKDPDLFF